MKAIDFMPYTVVAGVLLVSLAAPLFIGSEGWVVPLIVLPFALAYLVFDAMRKKRTSSSRDEH
jgi:hypothetical protein